MLALNFEVPAGSTVLCLGAHCDDIELGCGGTLHELSRRHPTLHFAWSVFSADAPREQETRQAASRLLPVPLNLDVEVYNFSASYFPARWSDIKSQLELIKQRPAPALIFTHYLHDRHQDHRLIAELTWNTFRDHCILEYEIAKYEGDLGHPALFMPLESSTVELKLRTIAECFPSQRDRTWFDPELFRGQLRMRGLECNAPSGYAEAFHARKLRL